MPKASWSSIGVNALLVSVGVAGFIASAVESGVPEWQSVSRARLSEFVHVLETLETDCEFDLLQLAYSVPIDEFYGSASPSIALLRDHVLGRPAPLLTPDDLDSIVLALDSGEVSGTERFDRLAMHIVSSTNVQMAVYESATIPTLLRSPEALLEYHPSIRHLNLYPRHLAIRIWDISSIYNPLHVGSRALGYGDWSWEESAAEAPGVLVRLTSKDRRARLEVQFDASSVLPVEARFQDPEGSFVIYKRLWHEPCPKSSENAGLILLRQGIEVSFNSRSKLASITILQLGPPVFSCEPTPRVEVAPDVRISDLRTEGREVIRGGVSRLPPEVRQWVKEKSAGNH